MPTVNSLVTNDNTPILTGTWDEAGATDLSIEVNGVTYILGTDSELTTNGSGAWVLNLSLVSSIPDGVYNVIAASSDAVGNSSVDITTNELTIDTTAPSIPTVNTLVTNDNTPILTGTWDESGAVALTITVDGTSYVLGTDSELTTNGSGVWSLDLSSVSPISDGVYNVTAVSSDTAGNSSTDVTNNELTIDTAAPAVPTVNTLVTNDNTPILTGTWDETSATALTVTVNGTTYTLATNPELTSNGSGVWTLDLSSATSIPDGVYDVVAVSSDAAGNSSTDITNNELTIDTTGPAIPTVNTLVTNDNTPVLNGTWDEAGSTALTVTVNGTTYTLATSPELTSNGSGAWTLDLSSVTAISDGVYEVVAVSTDASSNSSTDTSSNELTIDTAAPSIPTVNTLVTNDNTPILTGTWDEAGATSLTVAVNGTTYTLATSAELTSNGSGAWRLDLSSVSPIADGVYSVVAISTDASSNSSTDVTNNELTIDTAAPSIPTVNTLVTNDNTPVLTGTWDEARASGLTVEVNGTTYTLTTNPELTSNGSGIWTLDLSSVTSIPDGVHDVTAISTDAAGNSSTDATSSELTIDTGVPGVPTVNTLITNDNTPILTGSWDEAGSTGLTVEVNSVTYILATSTELTSSGSGSWTLDLSSITALPDNTYDVTAVSSDAASNSSTDITSNELTIDTVAPAVPTVNTLSTNDNTPVLTGTWNEINASTLSVTFNGITYTLGTDTELATNGSGDWSLDLSSAPPTPDGVYDVVAVSGDTSGNSSSDTTSNEITIDTGVPDAPTVNTAVTNDNTPTITGTWDEPNASVLTVNINSVIRHKS